MKNCSECCWSGKCKDENLDSCPLDSKMAELGYTEKIRHRAKLMSVNGDVSPLCAKTPRKLNLAKELWTIRDEAVTCPKCLAIIRDRNKK